MFRRLWRAAVRATAFVRGDFWLRCPLCGDMFPNGESRDYLYDRPFSGTARPVCLDCTPRVGPLNEATELEAGIVTMRDGESVGEFKARVERLRASRVGR